MWPELSLQRVVVASVALVAALFAIGWMTRENPDDRPYLRILGGGFIFNYRVSDIHYGFTALVQRPLPTGSIIEASFEDPGGAADHVVRQRVGTDTVQYTLRSPPLRGVEAGRRYTVSIRVFDRAEREVLWTHAMEFESRLDDRVVAEQPLTIGPGYARNPQLTE